VRHFDRFAEDGRLFERILNLFQQRYSGRGGMLSWSWDGGMKVARSVVDDLRSDRRVHARIMEDATGDTSHAVGMHHHTIFVDNLPKPVAARATGRVIAVVLVISVGLVILLLLLSLVQPLSGS